ncbi:MAG: hypothetical protein KJ941_01845 [Bacteroidetes bacterium]|nr:hypothetical protein [Bacteroidota bacterium]
MKSFVFLTIVVFSLFGCKKNKIADPVKQPTDNNSSELITTVQLTFTDSANVEPNYVSVFRDIDGPGGQDPSSFDTIRLKKGTVYFGQISLLNEAASPTEDITSEVSSEGDEHLFCYTPNNLGELVILRTDSDQVYEIGITTKWKTGSMARTGAVTVVLKHQPGVKDGTCSPGETDIELEFVVIIED